MNYAKMIEILEWVKAARNDRKGYGLGTSPYICDNVNRFQDGGDLSTSDAKQAIRQDIRERINHEFGVPEYLGYSDDDADDGLDNNDYQDVVAFRVSLIEELIARYTEAQNAAV